MSQIDIDTEKFKEVVYDAILDLHLVDHISWPNLSGYAGYSPTGLKNIVQQGAHNLEFSRGLSLMNMLSIAHSNKRLHKFTFDTSSEMLCPRPKVENATGDLTEESMKAYKCINDALEASRMKDFKTLSECYENMLQYIIRLREEVEAHQSILCKRNEPVTSLRLVS